ncbi:hypothetical protein PHYBOEH_011309 [Phytophthora boehmeriae]|uniref:HTH CENPB-type domain-containing protein n=1 Tax=Phytophthora boehmeriae TaxID=109152 RepID=A0A8T1WZH9_9STRA|nr:hypothetical protein PHYBOEH_011309 [Phytophthora boehmeriae]
MSSESAVHDDTAHLAPDICVPVRRPPQATGKRKRVVLSIHDKQQVLQQLENGEQPIAIAKSFGISRQQVSDIKRNKDRILSFCVDAKHMSTLRRKTLKATAEYHPGVEQELYRWVIRQRKLERQVTLDAMTHKTTDLFMQYSSDHSPRMSLKAIANWLRHFKRAHGIKALSEEEVAHLPEKFVPAMDMTRSVEVTATQSVANVAETAMETAVAATSASVPASYMVTSTAPHLIGITGSAPALPATVPMPGSGMPMSLDVNPYMSVMHPQQTIVPVSASSLQITTNMLHELNAHMIRFEHEMAMKLDYLDERVKLCFLLLPPRMN